MNALGVILAVILLVAPVLAQVPSTQPATKPGRPTLSEATETSDQAVAALRQAVHGDAVFEQQATRQAMRTALTALFEQRTADPDSPGSLNRYAQRIVDVYTMVGVDTGVPFPPKTEGDVDKLMALAVQHPFFAAHPPQPGTPQYNDLRRNIVDLTAMQLGQMLQQILTADDQFFGELQGKCKSNPETANDDVSTRPAMLKVFLKLLREGRMPK